MNEKFVSGIFGAIKCLCRQEDKGGRRGEEGGGGGLDSFQHLKTRGIVGG